MDINLEELERLAARVDPLPWKLNLHMGKVVRYTEHGNERFIADCLRVTKRDAHCKRNAAYIVAACNAVPKLVKMYREVEDKANNAWRILLEAQGRIVEVQKRVRELEERIAELTQENSGHKRVIHILENKVLALKGKPIPMEPRKFIPSSNRSNAKEAGE